MLTSLEDIISILHGLCKIYEFHHGVQIYKSTLVEVAILLYFYLSDYFLLDKDIDITNEETTKLKIKIISNPTTLDKINHDVLNLEMEKCKPRVDHFRVFGSPAWAQSLDEKHKAMEKKSEPCIFVGYCEDVKAYRLLILGTQEVIFRRNVQIEELECDYDLNQKGDLKYGNLMSLQRQLEAIENELYEYESNGKLILR
eukprot:Gb_40728 [translate_table: standard]